MVADHYDTFNRAFSLQSVRQLTDTVPNPFLFSQTHTHTGTCIGNGCYLRYGCCSFSDSFEFVQLICRTVNYTNLWRREEWINCSCKLYLSLFLSFCVCVNLYYGTNAYLPSNNGDDNDTIRSMSKFTRSRE